MTGPPKYVRQDTIRSARMLASTERNCLYAALIPATDWDRSHLWIESGFRPSFTPPAITPPTIML